MGEAYGQNGANGKLVNDEEFGDRFVGAGTPRQHAVGLYILLGKMLARKASKQPVAISCDDPIQNGAAPPCKGESEQNG